MRYRVSLSDFTVDAESPDQAQLEAVQTVLESPDLFVVQQDMVDAFFPGYDPARGPLVVGPAPTLGDYKDDL